jgi:hypothetical protein
MKILDIFCGRRLAVATLAILVVTFFRAESVTAQTGIDTFNMANLDSLRATPQEERRVLKEVNKRNTEMLLRQWWNLPTDKETERRNRGLYSRYSSTILPIGGETFMARAGEQTARRQTAGRVLPDQNVIAMGWHPYWMGQTRTVDGRDTTIDAYKEYSFALLSHVAYYSYELNPYTGGYRNFDAIYNFKYSDFIPTAHLDTCSVLLSVSCRGEDAALFFTGEAIARQNLIDSLVSILEMADADGIELSFEEVPRTQKDEFIAFVKDLSYELREANNKYTIMMSIPLYDKDNVYSLADLRPWVDYFIISAFNHHVTPLGLVRGAIAPLREPEAPIRGTTVAYSNYLTLDSLVRNKSELSIAALDIAHSKDYIEELVDSLDYYMKRGGLQVPYRSEDINSIVYALMTPAAAGLRENEDVRRWLKKSIAIVELRKTMPATEMLSFFLFRPEPTNLYMLEYEQFNLLANNPNSQKTIGYIVRDSFGKLMHAPIGGVKNEVSYDLRQAVQERIAEIGEGYKSSLVLGLPYHGAVWNMRQKEPVFEGYIPYGQIRQLMLDQGGELLYDKYYTSMILRISDSLGLVREVYFDNSATLEHKIEYALDAGLGGVSVWALGYDYGYPDLWRLFEQSFVMPRFLNPETNKFEKIKLEKSNKVAFTLQYQLKRLSRVIFATFFIVAIFMILGFNVVLLDWKVRDILFYTGSFRIFYLTLFTMIILFIGSSVGIFRNAWIAFLVGTLLGLTLTWIATILTKRQQERLP